MPAASVRLGAAASHRAARCTRVLRAVGAAARAAALHSGDEVAGGGAGEAAEPAGLPPGTRRLRRGEPQALPLPRWGVYTRPRASPAAGRTAAASAGVVDVEGERLSEMRMGRVAGK